ncbi:hypothetical protein ACFW04_013941 [Cataglyphis niger]
MKKIESKKLNFSKESFEDYVLEKFSLMQRLRLPDDSIHFLIGGINNDAICSAAFVIRANTSSMKCTGSHSLLEV